MCKIVGGDFFFPFHPTWADNLQDAPIYIQGRSLLINPLWRYPYGYTQSPEACFMDLGTSKSSQGDK